MLTIDHVRDLQRRPRTCRRHARAVGGPRVRHRGLRGSWRPVRVADLVGIADGHRVRVAAADRTSTAQPVEGQCATSSLTGTIGQGGGGVAGSEEVTLVLTNHGSAQCSLQGWPGVSFVGDGNGTQLGTPADFDRSTPHATVVLRPGGTAQAPLKIVQAMNYPEADCKPQKADGFRVYPPGSTESLFVRDDTVTACTTTTVTLLTVGALAAP